MLSHLNALAFVDWAAAEFGVGADDRLSSHAPLHFDLSIFDLFAAAARRRDARAGARRDSRLPGRARARSSREPAITVWYSVPSVLTMLALRGEPRARVDLPRLRAVLFAGEVFPTKYLRRLMELLPHVAVLQPLRPHRDERLHLVRGARRRRGRDRPIPIGRRSPASRCSRIDETRRGGSTPARSASCCVRGPDRDAGYWGDAERTARRSSDPPSRRAGSAPTGPATSSRQDADGDYCSSAAGTRRSRAAATASSWARSRPRSSAHPAVVGVRGRRRSPTSEITNRIAAFIVPGTRESVTEHDLTRHCAARLPPYMVPETFDLVDELPTTFNPGRSTVSFLSTGSSSVSCLAKQDHGQGHDSQIRRRGAPVDGERRRARRRHVAHRQWGHRFAGNRPDDQLPREYVRNQGSRRRAHAEELRDDQLDSRLRRKQALFLILGGLRRLDRTGVPWLEFAVQL